MRMGNTGGGLLVLYNVYLFLAWLKMMDQFSVHKCRIVKFQNQRCVTVYGRFKFWSKLIGVSALQCLRSRRG